MAYDQFKEARNALSFSQKLRDGLSTASYFPQSFAEETMKLGGNVARETGRAVLQAGSFPLDIMSLAKGEEPMQPVDVPGIGKVKTLAREAVDMDREGGQTALSGAGAVAKSIGNFATGVASASGLTGLAKGAINMFKKPAYDAPTQIGNHVKSGRMILDDMSGSTSGNKLVDTKGVMERLKVNIVDDAKRTNPQLADELSKLPTAGFETPEEFGRAALRIAKSMGGNLSDDVVAATLPGGEPVSDYISENLEEGLGEDVGPAAGAAAGFLLPGARKRQAAELKNTMSLMRKQADRLISEGQGDKANKIGRIIEKYKELIRELEE